MSGTKIENFSVSAFKAAATAEKFTAGKPAGKNHFIWSGNIEMFTVCLFVWKLKIFTETGSDRVGRLDDPNSFKISSLTPFEVASGTHKLFEDF